MKLKHGSAVILIIFGGLLCACQKDAADNQTKMNLKVDQAKKMLERQSDIQLVDVRTVAEWEQGRLKGADHIPSFDFERRISELDKNKFIMIYCASGGRSRRALSLLKKYGFENCAHIASGIRGWR